MAASGTPLGIKVTQQSAHTHPQYGGINLLQGELIHLLQDVFPLCGAGVALTALGDALGPGLTPVTPRHFAWQAWHLVTWTVTLCGKRGTYGTG